ncbi:MULTISPECIES: NADH-quinone oxidoreductase subunit C [Streptomyces]|uniref:NADH-quinone oxidoreductase subunit C n=1 Tax=Streptomyces TaxID=1883 RepID=UPI001E57433C|nr:MULTISPECIES: NADH-quinone oxidoreductase subunit C [Streptomyces]UFQ17417.1 NADH-quinone oxidoreductase subunit C [Streptomyces huasconensis]WCL87023.1 NADH-quinone oxidoreductase subunit C [Streptomyces sp. JCM 35825]
MTGWLPSPVEELFGAEATAEESYDVLTVDVPPAQWTTALETARTTLSCTYFDWLSAVDEPGTGFRICAHVVALAPVRRLLLRTTVPHDAPVLASAVGVYAGAAWHERETHEMFGVTFEGHPGLTPLLLPENFEGHPLRKDFVLAARVAKAWPGAKEPGESEHGGPKRRQMLPPGVPDPNEWGPLKGQLPAAPTRPARGAGRAATGDRPVRRTRSASEGSASQPATSQQPEAPSRPPRRSRSVTQGSASQRPTDTPTPTPTPTEAEAVREPVSEPEPAGGTAAKADPPTNRPSPPRSSDAPWHHARPTFDAPPHPTTPEPESPEPEAERPADKPTRPEPKPARAAAEPTQPAAAPVRPEPQTNQSAAEPDPQADRPAAAPARPEPEADRPVAESMRPEPQTNQSAAEPEPQADRPAAAPARPEPETDRPATEPTHPEPQANQSAAEPKADRPAAAPARAEPEADGPVAEPAHPEPQANQSAAEREPEPKADRPAAAPARPEPQPNQPAAAPKPDPAPGPAANPTSPTTPSPANDDRTGGTE